MLKKDAVKFFGSGSELAKRLGIRRQAVYQWPDVVPFKKAMRLEELTKGSLKMKKSLYT